MSNELVYYFSPRLMQPIFVLAMAVPHQPVEPTTVWSHPYFDELCQFGDELIAKQYVNNSGIKVFLGGYTLLHYLVLLP